MTYFRAQKFRAPMTSKSHKNDKCIEIAGNLRNAITVYITHQLHVLAKLPDVKMTFFIMLFINNAMLERVNSM